MIVTASTSVAQEPISTPCGRGQNAADWLQSHKERVHEANDEGWQIGAGLTTSWMSANGKQTATDMRYLGPPEETDDEVIDRHFDNVATKMIANPPIP